jgi:hypothetical protein
VIPASENQHKMGCPCTGHFRPQDYANWYQSPWAGGPPQKKALLFLLLVTFQARAGRPPIGSVSRTARGKSVGLAVDTEVR